MANKKVTDYDELIGAPAPDDWFEMVDRSVTTGADADASGKSVKVQAGNMRGGVPLGMPLDSGGTMVGLPGVTFNAQSSFGLVGNRLHLNAFIIQTPTTVDAMMADVTVAAGAGGIIRFGIYQATDTTWQTLPLIKDAGTVAADTTGLKTATFTAMVLQPGRYLAGIVASLGGTVRTVRGTVPFGKVAGSTGYNFFNYFYRDIGGTTLPDPAGAMTLAYSTVTDNMSMLRITSIAA